MQQAEGVDGAFCAAAALRQRWRRGLDLDRLRLGSCYASSLTGGSPSLRIYFRRNCANLRLAPAMRWSARVFETAPPAERETRRKDYEHALEAAPAQDVARFVATYAGRKAPKITGQPVCTDQPVGTLPPLATATP